TVNCMGTAAAGTCTLAPTSAGTKTLTATYAGDANFNGSSGTASHMVINNVLRLFLPLIVR
ncbi:MAG TPA: Ig-like domain-containing protein, partial [Anaerolineales bacterium]